MKFSRPGIMMILALGSMSLTFADTWTTGTAGQTTSGSSTRVGIGNASPAAQLDISSNTLNREGFIVNQIQANSPIARFRQNGNTKMLITNSGQIGIGTTSPTRTVDVVGTVKATAIEGNGIFPITAFGAVPNNTGTAYDAQFDAALAAAAATGGTVYFPPGRYTLNSPHNIPSGVTVQGAWNAPHDAKLNQGTTFLTNCGNNQVNGTPFITLLDDAALIGVTIYYPSQTNPTSPTPFSWTIRGTNDGDVINVTLANSYLGIDFATNRHNSHFLSNVNITALLVGVAVDQCYDVGRLENVHVHPKFWWTAANWAQTSPEAVALQNYILTNLYAFKFGFMDWENVSGCFAIWAHVGMYFYQGAPAADNPSTWPSGQFTKSGVDVSVYALLIDRVQSWPSIGLNFSDCNFVGGIIATANNQGPVKMSNCSFLQFLDSRGVHDMIHWDGTGTLSLSNSSFGLWGNGVNTPAISVINGAALVSNNDFVSTGYPVLSIQAAASVSFVGNRIRNAPAHQVAPGAVLNQFGNITR